jgi:hypothetical protein
MSFRKPHPLAFRRCSVGCRRVAAMSAQPSYGPRYAQDRAEIKRAVAVFKERIGKLYKDKEGQSGDAAPRTPPGRDPCRSRPRLDTLAMGRDGERRSQRHP